MLTYILLGTLAMTLAAAFVLSRLFDKQHQLTRVHCEARHADFEVDVLVRPKPWNFGDDHDIVRCSAFEDPSHVTCDKRCLEPLVQLRAVHHT